MSQMPYINIPKIDPDKLNNGTYLRQIANCLLQLDESIRYMFGNIDDENFTTEYKKVIDDKVNHSEFTQTSKSINLSISNLAESTAAALEVTADAIRQEVTDLADNTTAQFQVTATEISSKVSKDGVVSSINQTAEIIKILASKIQFEGLVTANQYFKILEDGSAEAKRFASRGEDRETIISDGALQSTVINLRKFLRDGGAYTPAQILLFDGNSYLYIDPYEITFHDSTGAVTETYLSSLNYGNYIESGNISATQSGGVVEIGAADVYTISKSFEMFAPIIHTHDYVTSGQLTNAMNTLNNDLRAWVTTNFQPKA